MNRLLSRMAKTGQTDPVDNKKQLKSPKKQNPAVICYDSIFAENCDESIEEVAEEVMEITEDVCTVELPLDASQEDLSSEEEQTESPTVPESLEEVDLYMVLLCWFGLACTAVHAICTGNTCRCQICRMTLLRKECDLADLVTLLRRNTIELEPVREVKLVVPEEESSQDDVLQDDLV